MRPARPLETPGRRPAHGRSAARACAVLAVLAATAAAVLASPHVALTLGPALLLLLTVAVGRFPGEDVIARARRRRTRRRGGRAPRRTAGPRVPRLVRPAGVTLAFALAMRPPPALLPR